MPTADPTPPPVDPNARPQAIADRLAATFAHATARGRNVRLGAVARHECPERCRIQVSLARDGRRLGGVTLTVRPGRRAVVALRLTKAAARVARRGGLSGQFKVEVSAGAGTGVARGEAKVRRRR